MGKIKKKLVFCTRVFQIIERFFRELVSVIDHSVHLSKSKDAWSYHQEYLLVSPIINYHFKFHKKKITKSKPLHLENEAE